MKFSIILCTYNQAESLAVVLSGMKNQNLPDHDFELVVVDNNSADATKEICESAFSQMPFACKYVFEPRQGLSIARNRGVMEANGEYLIFTDDDARLPQNWLQGYAQGYVTHNAECIFGQISVDWAKGQPAWYSKKFGPMFVELNYGLTPLLITDFHHEFFGKNFSLRKETLLEMGGFDENLGRKGDRLFLGEETKIYRWLVTQHRKIMYLPEILVYHRLKDHEYTEAHCYKHAKDASISEYYLLRTGSGRKVFGRPVYALIKASTIFFNAFTSYLTIRKKAEYADIFYLKVSVFKAIELLKNWVANKP